MVFHQDILPVLPFVHQESLFGPFLNKLPKESLNPSKVAKILHENQTGEKIIFLSHIFDHPERDLLMTVLERRSESCGLFISWGEELKLYMEQVLQLLEKDIEVTIVFNQLPTKEQWQALPRPIKLQCQFLYMQNQLFPWDKECLKDDLHIVPAKLWLPEKTSLSDQFFSEHALVRYMPKSFSHFVLCHWLDEDGKRRPEKNPFFADLDPAKVPGLFSGNSFTAKSMLNGLIWLYDNKMYFLANFFTLTLEAFRGGLKYFFVRLYWGILSPLYWGVLDRLYWFGNDIAHRLYWVGRRTVSFLQIIYGRYIVRNLVRGYWSLVRLYKALHLFFIRTTWSIGGKLYWLLGYFYGLWVRVYWLGVKFCWGLVKMYWVIYKMYRGVIDAMKRGYWRFIFPVFDKIYHFTAYQYNKRLRPLLTGPRA